MAREIDVNFPKYMNEYPLFVYFPIDLVLVAFIGFFSSFWIISLYFGVLPSLISGMGVGVYTFIKYKDYKRNTAPGILYHTMFILGFTLLKPTPDSGEFDDVNLDVENFFPAGYETEFQD